MAPLAVLGWDCVGKNDVAIFLMLQMTLALCRSSAYFLPANNPPNVNNDGSCNFDTGICNYVNPWRPTAAVRQWIRRTTGTPSGFTGPTADHTPGAGSTCAC